MMGEVLSRYRVGGRQLAMESASTVGLCRMFIHASPKPGWSPTVPRIFEPACCWMDGGGQNTGRVGRGSV